MGFYAWRLSRLKCMLVFDFKLLADMVGWHYFNPSLQPKKATVLTEVRLVLFLSPLFSQYFLLILNNFVVVYGSENWSLNRSDKRKIKPAEMRFLRSMAGYTLWDEKRSSDIREQLGLFNINDKLTQYKINWRQQRMDDNRLPKKKILITNVKGEEI